MKKYIFNICSYLSQKFLCLEYIHSNFFTGTPYKIHKYKSTNVYIHYLGGGGLEYLAQSTDNLSAVLLGGQEELIDIVESHPPVNMTEPLE